MQIPTNGTPSVSSVSESLNVERGTHVITLQLVNEPETPAKVS